MPLIATDLSQKGAIIFLTIITTIYLMICAPVVVYYTLMLWKLNQQNILYFRKRHCKLVIFSVILFNTYPLIIRPIVDTMVIKKALHRHDPLSIFFANTIQLFPIIICLRLWLLYYDYNYGLQSLAFKWKQQIRNDNKNDHDHVPWTLKYKWLGNVKKLTTFAVILGLFLITFVVVGGSILGPHATSWLQTAGIFVFIFMFVIGYKIRTCRDEFSIRKEFVMGGITLTICMITYAPLVILFDVGSLLQALLTNIIISACCYSFSLIPTYWIIKQYNRKQSNKQQFQDNNSDRETLTLEEILLLKDGFDLFANHLVNEFSLENLFFIFDLVNIKREVLKNKLCDEKDIGCMIQINSGRIEKFKRKNSDIHNIHDLKENIEYIMNKYIDHADLLGYAINISSNVRRMVSVSYQEVTVMSSNSQIVYDNKTEDNEENVYEDQIYNENELIKRYIVMFDKAFKEIIRLLQGDTAYRFRCSAEYGTLTK